MKAQGAALSDALILKMAKEKAEQLGIKPFSGSGGWLANFKHRQGIRSHMLHQESDAANVLTSLASSMLPCPSSEEVIYCTCLYVTCPELCTLQGLSDMQCLACIVLEDRQHAAYSIALSRAF